MRPHRFLMDFSVSTLLDKISSTELLKTASVCVVILTIHIQILFGLLPGLLIVISYVIGFSVFHLLTKYVCNLDDILSFLTSAILQRCWPISAGKINTDSKQDDHLIISLDIDNALEKLMNRIVDLYVSHWYNNISTDENFLHEIRVVFQSLVSNSYKRVSRVEIDKFILKKLLPVCLNHVHSYDKLKSDENTSYLHIAAHSRTAELLYLRNVSKSIMKYILPDSELRCKSFTILFREILTRNIFLALSDTVCNPDILNLLLLHYLKGYYNFLSGEVNDDVEKVVLLEKFVSALHITPLYSCLRPDLASIFKDDDLKETFMQYLRAKAADHLLQFCIDIKILEEKLSRQDFDLESEELDNLYRDFWDLYSVYFSSYSPNCIQFEKDYASILRKTLSKDLLKLRSTKTLSDAHDHVYSRLKSYCNNFYCSNEFYLWLYGRFEASELLRSQEIFQMNDDIVSGASLERKPGFELSNKFSMIKEVLKPNQILEGQIQEISDGEVSMELGEDIKMTVSSKRKNLNTWRISIPAVGSRLDPITNKAYTVFVIQTETESGEDWLVERRPNDFYTLDVKLTEFHGSFQDVQLPPRRLMTSRSECIQMYEDYLNKLVKIPELNSSELISTFLSSIEDFEEEETGFSKLFRKSVVPTLRIERGQNLDAFISTLVNSCRMTSKYEWKETEQKNKSRKSKSISHIYANIFDVDPDVSQQIFYTRTLPPNDCIYERPSTSILYLGIRMFKVQDKIVKFFLALQSFFGGMLDALMNHFIKRSLIRILSVSNISYMINFTEKAVFDSKQKSNAEETKVHLLETLESLKNNWLHPVYVLLRDVLQDAKLNKQLFYQVMDVALEELFPELNEIGRRC